MMIMAATTESSNFKAMPTNFAFRSSEEGCRFHKTICRSAATSSEGHIQYGTMRNARVARLSSRSGATGALTRGQIRSRGSLHTSVGEKL